MNNCDKFQQSFSSYIDGDLTPDSRKHLEGHLELCPRCTETIYRMTRLRDSLLTLPRIKTSAEFEQKLQHYLGYGNRLNMARYPNRQFSWKYPVIGFAVVFFIAGFFMMYSPSHPEVDFNPPTESSFSPNISGQSVNQRDTDKIPATSQPLDTPQEADSLYQNNDLEGGSNNTIKLIKESKNR